MRFDISRLSGVKESTRTTMGYLFFSTETTEVIQKIKDDRIQKEVNNQGLMFVKEEFAEKELVETKQYSVKKYETTWCNAPK